MFSARSSPCINCQSDIHPYERIGTPNGKRLLDDHSHICAVNVGLTQTRSQSDSRPSRYTLADASEASAATTPLA